MKKMITVSIILTTCLIVVFNSCKKYETPADVVTAAVKKKKKTRSITGITVNSRGIPCYADSATFVSWYLTLHTQINDSITSVYSGVSSSGFTQYQLDSTTIPNDLFERAMSPLGNFAANVGFNSLWNKVHLANNLWMSDTTKAFSTYPDNDYAIDDILKSMLNEDGDMIIGSKIYHYICERVPATASPNNVTEIGVLEMPVDSIYYLDSLNDNPNMNKIANLHQWPLPTKSGKYHSFFPFDNPNPDKTCTNNRANWGTEEYYDRKKYYWKNGFNFDILGTHAFSNMEVWHKSRTLGWIHDLQSLQLPLQLKTLDKDCNDETNQYSAPSLWGPYCQANANWWGTTYRNIEKNYFDANHNVTSKSFYKKHYLTW